jgi:hypothetical protein
VTTPATLLADLARLRRERDRLRNMATRRRAERHKLAVARLVDRAVLDALALATVHVGGGAVGRDYAPLPQRRWAYAVAMLRMSGLAAPGRDVCLVLPHNLDHVVERLDAAATAAKVMPSRYLRHLPPSLAPRLLRDARKMQQDSTTTHSAGYAPGRAREGRHEHRNNHA